MYYRKFYHKGVLLYRVKRLGDFTHIKHLDSHGKVVDVSIYHRHLWKLNHKIQSIIKNMNYFTEKERSSFWKFDEDLNSACLKGWEITFGNGLFDEVSALLPNGNSLKITKLLEGGYSCQNVNFPELPEEKFGTFAELSEKYKEYVNKKKKIRTSRMVPIFNRTCGKKNI